MSYVAIGLKEYQIHIITYSPDEIIISDPDKYDGIYIFNTDDDSEIAVKKYLTWTRKFGFTDAQAIPVLLQLSEYFRK
jgi:hypothetical protein